MCINHVTLNDRFEAFEWLKYNIHNKNHLKPAQIAVESRLQPFGRVYFAVQRTVQRDYLDKIERRYAMCSLWLLNC